MGQQRALYQKESENANPPGRSGRWAFALGGLVLLVLLAVGGYFLLRPDSPAYVVVHRGDIRGTVIATGEVVSERQTQLSSRVSGQITMVSVEAGDEVLTGTLLVAIEAESLRYRVDQARLKVEIARTRLAQASEAARPEAVAGAEADLNLAQARLQALVSTPQGQEIAILRQEVGQAQAALDWIEQVSTVGVGSAHLNWETAANSLRDAQHLHEDIRSENERLRQSGVEPNEAQIDGETSALLRVEDAEEALEWARLAYEQTLQDQQANVSTAQAYLVELEARLQGLLFDTIGLELVQAEAQVARSQAYLDQQLAGPRESDLQILEAELRAAELSLEEALADLDKATVSAPFAGTVVEIGVEQGELVGLYVALVSIADLDKLEIEARIDEIDVGQLAPGQVVTITLDAFPGQPFRGTVDEIAPAVTVDRGSAFYMATVSFARVPTSSVRLGMAASLEVVTVERQGVLLIPRQAVERVGAGDYVTVLRGDRRERARVILGASDAVHYEVLSGLSEGDQVLLP